MNLNPFRRQQTEYTEEVTDFWEIRDAFIQYIRSESSSLQLDDFSKNDFEGQYIGYDCGYKTNRTYAFGGHDIFLSAGLSFQNSFSISNGILAAALVFKSESEHFQSHYKKMEERQIEIKKCFFLIPSTSQREDINFKKVNTTH